MTYILQVAEDTERFRGQSFPILPEDFPTNPQNLEGQTLSPDKGAFIGEWETL